MCWNIDIGYLAFLLHPRHLKVSNSTPFYTKPIPGASFDVPVIPYINAKDHCRITLIWNDEYGKDRSQEQTISF
jgi:hypothetical protein